jgi:hypothetical protein
MKTIKYDRQSILDALAEDVVKVVFTKKDGSERTMRCTRDLRRAIHAPIPKTENFVEDNPEVIRAYDLEAEGWRSFIVANVKSVESFA